MQLGKCNILTYQGGGTMQSSWYFGWWGDLCIRLVRSRSRSGLIGLNFHLLFETLLYSIWVVGVAERGGAKQM
jgi:hypothetical protein